MFVNWGFLTGEIWALLIAALLIGVALGYLARQSVARHSDPEPGP